VKGHLREERGHYESGIALGAAAVAAAGTAYAANQQKKAQKEALKASNRTTHTDQTTTTKSGGWDNPGLQDDLEYARQQARGLYDAGPVLFGKGGKGGGGGPDLSKFPAGSSARPDGRVIGPDGKTIGQVAPSAAGKGGGGKGGGKGKGSGKPSMANQARDIAQQVIDTGRAGNPNTGAADAFIGRALAPGGMGGNEVNADLYNRLGNVNFDTGMDYLSSFLGGVDGVAKGGGQQQGPARPGGGSGGALVRYNAAGTRAARQAEATQMAQGGGVIPDSTRGGGLFNDFAKEVLDEKAFLNPDDPVIKDYLDALRRDMTEDLELQLQDVGDEFEGVGMYGGSGLALERGRVRNEGLEDIGDASAKALMEARSQGIDLMGQMAGQVNQRDISGAQISSSERAAREASRAAAGEAAASREAQMQIATRGQDLDAIGMMLNYQGMGMNQLAGLGERLSGDRFGAIQSMGAVDQARYGGLEKAFGAANTMAQQDAAAAARRAQIDYQNRMAPARHLDDYLSRLGFFNGLGSTSTQRTVGDNVVPPSGGPAPNPWASGAMAGLGAFGAAGGFNNIGTGGNAPYAGGSVGINGGPYVQQPRPTGGVGIG
jgi:hypothetical protein